MTAINPQIRAGKIRQAQAFLQQNHLAEARDIYANLCQADANDAESQFMLGTINGKLGNLDAAIQSFRHVIAIQPQAAMAHFGLGSTLKMQGKLEEAVNSLRQAVQINPNMPGAYFELGNILHALGKPSEAKESLLQSIRLMPTADAYFLLGRIQFYQGQITEAIASYQAALKLTPARADILSSLGFAYFSTGAHELAIESCHQAIKLAPNFPNAHNNLGRALIALGRVNEAVISFKEALRIQPDFVRAAACIVAAYEMAGEQQKAAEYLEPLIERHPDDAAVAMAFARLCKHLGRCGEAIGMIEKKILPQQGLSPLDRRELHFSLGKLYDSMGEYDKAFAHFQSANALQPLPYDPENHTRYIDSIISSFNSDAMRRLPRANHGSDRPVFIVGMPRSGTSLVEQILASHPQVFGAGELKEIGNIAGKTPGILQSSMAFPGCIDLLDQANVNSLAQEYLAYIHSLSPDAARITDKMPHNFLFLGLIALFFPNARIIHCMRDPRDTCLSIYFQYLNASHAYACDLHHTGTHYREYERLMAHWRQVINIPMLEMRYEELVSNPDEMIPKLVEFCGLEWNPDCLRFYETKRMVTTVSYDQVRQPLTTKSVGRWKHYEQHLEPLKAGLGVP